MRICIVVSIALFAACGGKKADGTAGGGSTTGSSVAGGTAGSAAAGSATAAGSGAGSGSAGSAAAAGKPAYCVTNENENTLIAFAADEKTATFCIGKETDAKAAPKCTTVDLGTGAYRAAAAAPPPAPVSDSFAVKQDAKGVEVCRGNACKKLDLPKPKPGEDGELKRYQISASEDGKRVVATGAGLAGVVFLDGGTGKKLRTVKVGDDSGVCLERAQILGESVYVETSNCAGPGGSAVLYSWAGKKLGDVEKSEEVNVYGAEPVHVGGDSWAAAGFGGGSVLVFSAKTGKQVQLMEVKQPEDCEQCGMVLGNAAQWSAQPLVKLPSGKLVTLDGSGVSILDPAAGKVEKTHRMPICPAKP